MCADLQIVRRRVQKNCIHDVIWNMVSSLVPAGISNCPNCLNYIDDCNCVCPYCSTYAECDCAIGIGAATGGG
jgi:hypothetical protein